MLIAIIYPAIVVFVFTFVPYAIIVDNLKAFEGIKKASTILIGLLGSFVVAPLTSMWWILLYVKLGEAIAITSHILTTL